jgi:hypothetical protein
MLSEWSKAESAARAHGDVGAAPHVMARLVFGSLISCWKQRRRHSRMRETTQLEV